MARTVRKKSPEWRKTPHRMWILSKEMVYLDESTGILWDQAGNILPPDETLQSRFDDDVSEIIETVKNFRIERAEGKYKQRLERAMEEARAKELKRIRRELEGMDEVAEDDFDAEPEVNVGGVSNKTSRLFPGSPGDLTPDINADLEDEFAEEAAKTQSKRSKAAKKSKK